MLKQCLHGGMATVLAKGFSHTCISSYTGDGIIACMVKRSHNLDFAVKIIAVFWAVIFVIKNTITLTVAPRTISLNIIDR